MAESKNIRWIPLESNPEVLTKYSRSLGLTRGEWVDVYGFDEELLAMLPQPVKALILLFPISEQYDAFCKERDSDIEKKGQVIASDLFYMKQTIGNACGTIGLIHALANNAKELEIVEGELAKFLKEVEGKSPAERGRALEESRGITETHEEVAHDGQTEAPSADDKLVTHFVALVQKDGHLYELDGRRSFPINHGQTTPESFLKDAAGVCKARIEACSKDSAVEYRFTAVALTTGTAGD